MSGFYWLRLPFDFVAEIHVTKLPDIEITEYKRNIWKTKKKTFQVFNIPLHSRLTLFVCIKGKFIIRRIRPSYLNRLKGFAVNKNESQGKRKVSSEIIVN